MEGPTGRSRPTFRFTRPPSSEPPAQSKPRSHSNPRILKGSWPRAFRVPTQLSHRAAATPCTRGSSKRRRPGAFCCGWQIWLSQDASRTPSFHGSAEPEHGRSPSSFREVGAPHTELRRARRIRWIPPGERLADTGRCAWPRSNRRAWTDVLPRPCDPQRASSRWPPARRLLRSSGAATSGARPSARTPGAAPEAKPPVKENAPGPETRIPHAAASKKSPKAPSEHGSTSLRPTFPISTDPHRCSCFSTAARGCETSGFLGFSTPQSPPGPLPRSTWRCSTPAARATGGKASAFPAAKSMPSSIGCFPSFAAATT